MDKLDEIPGIGPPLGQELVAEIDVIMTVFPTAAHLVSWAKFAPIDNQSAGRAKTASSCHDARINQQRRQRDLTRQLEHLTGKKAP